jgi:hypothetical protein
MIEGWRNVFETNVRAESRIQGKRFLHTGIIVTEFDTGFETIKEYGSNGDVTFAGEPFDDGADRSIDAEDLLNDNNTPLARAAGLARYADSSLPSLDVSFIQFPMLFPDLLIHSNDQRRHGGVSVPFAI